MRFNAVWDKVLHFRNRERTDNKTKKMLHLYHKTVSIKKSICLPKEISKNIVKNHIFLVVEMFNKVIVVLKII
ncbi:hypothetical protein C0R09_20070 [Brevibacillus laterosporus]|nr:hypothetical protein C0R09_20070 [Brevibacillus laterosporus]AYK05496.1 hypothetical protein D8Z77_03210 [Brevibacillus laterosporus]ERM17181.1 hypothetical protein P615_21635 [Brevibacillus laterosporus PE36]PCN43411.1 hypothetical protein B9C88_15905 [Brevibacillus laterosporus]